MKLSLPEQPGALVSCLRDHEDPVRQFVKVRAEGSFRPVRAEPFGVKMSIEHIGRGSARPDKVGIAGCPGIAECSQTGDDGTQRKGDARPRGRSLHRERIARCSDRAP